MGTAQLSTPKFFMVFFYLVREMLYIYLHYVTKLASIRQNRSFSTVNGHKVDDQVLIPGRGRQHSLNH